jgi:hypothetical protein
MRTKPLEILGRQQTEQPVGLRLESVSLQPFGVSRRSYEGQSSGGDADIAAAMAIERDIADEMAKLGVRL